LKKIFACFVNKKDIENNSKLIGAYIEKIPYRKIILKIKEKYPDVRSIGIVLHNKEIIKKISNLVFYNPLVRIYEAEKRGEIIYKFSQAIKQNDFIIVVPDDFVINYFTFQKIIKLLNEEERKYCGYSKDFLKLGAEFIYEIDYFKDGEMIGKFLNDYFNKNLKKTKIFYSENIKFYKK